MSAKDFEEREFINIEQSVTGNEHQIAGRDIHNYFFSSLPMSIDCSPEELAEVERIARNLISDARRRLLLSKANVVLLVGVLGIMTYNFSFAGSSLLPDNLRWLELLMFFGYLVAMLGLPAYYIAENCRKEGMFISIGKARLNEVETILRYQAAAKR